MSNLTSRPTPTANTVAAHLAIQAAQAGLKTIIFVQQAGHAPSTARKIADILPHPDAITETENTLWTAITAELGGGQYSLVDPEHSALPHNGDMTPSNDDLLNRFFEGAMAQTLLWPRQH